MTKAEAAKLLRWSRSQSRKGKAARVLGRLGGLMGKGKEWRVEINRRAGKARAAQLKAERAMVLKERMEANLKANGTVIVRT